MTRSTYFTLLKQKGFGAFLGTQFLGALNDNLLKWVITFLVGAGLSSGGSGSQGIDLQSISLAFILPSLLFTGLAGFLADNFNKRKVLIVTKAFEMGTMGLAWAALRSGQFQLQLGVLFLLSTQFTFFGPAKYGILPELVEDAELSRANGLLEMSTFLAIILGSTLAGPLFMRYHDHIDSVALILLALAMVGSLMSLGIGAVPEAAGRKPFKISLLWSEVIAGTRELRANRRLWLTTMGIAYFWFQGALFQLAVVLLGKQVLAMDETHISALGVALAIGIGVGSLLAGRWSGDKVELGLVPLGSLGMGFSSIFLAWSCKAAPALVPLGLGLVGASAGLFVVPLNALLQQKAEAGARGRIQAASNFYSTLGIIASALTLGFLSKHFSADRIVLFAGLGCFAMSAYLIVLLPEFLLRFCLWLLTHTLYRIRIEGAANVPQTGPALIVCNHTSLADGLLVQSCIQRFVRFMVYKPIYDFKPLHAFFELAHTIPISAKREDAAHGLAQAQDELRRGHVVCIFAEGGITRTGNLLRFRRGLERVMEGIDVPIIPVHMEGLWHSLFSFRGGKLKLRLPERLPYPVTISFGAPLPASTHADAIRHKVQELGSAALDQRLGRDGRLEERFVRNAKRRYFQLAMADSLGRQLSYGKSLAASLALAGWMKHHVKEPLVGILLPASVAGALANLAASFAGKATVNLNFTAGPAFMADAAQQCGLKTILSSRAFIEKAGLQAPEGTVFMEDLVGPGFKARTLLWWLGALLCPTPLLAALLKQPGGSPDDLSTVVFSSGSTGTPKGVMLTHKNVLANLEGLGQVLDARPQDRLMASLPLFHSLGTTGGIWFPLGWGFAALYHPNPLEAAAIGRLAQRHGMSLLFSTPTFAQAYARKIPAEQFAHLRYALVGAEKLRPATAQAFKERFGVDLQEGYGCTEMAPLVSVNLPDIDEGGEHNIGHKAGTVGAPVPGVSAKVVDIDTGIELPTGQAGLLLVKGPNRMAGYWQRPDLTEAALRDGWYVTGDVASLDADGFITLTDRLSRFSKLGGEMVPHLRIEEAARAFIHEDAHCLVAAVPDDAKGERLVLLHTDGLVDAATLWAQLSASELPKLWIPRMDAIFQVQAIPSLGTGKPDLKGSRDLALSLSKKEA